MCNAIFGLFWPNPGSPLSGFNTRPKFLQPFARSFTAGVWVAPNLDHVSVLISCSHVSVLSNPSCHLQIIFLLMKRGIEAKFDKVKQLLDFPVLNQMIRKMVPSNSTKNSVLQISSTPSGLRLLSKRAVQMKFNMTGNFRQAILANKRCQESPLSRQ